MVLVVLRILNMCVLVLWYVWSAQSEFMAVFIVFNLWIVTGFIFESSS